MEQRSVGPGGLAPPARCWTLTDGRAGNARQASALAAALGLVARDWLLEPRPPWGWAAPRLLPGSDKAFGAGFARAQSAPPALAIGCGRQGALATRLLRAAGARTVQILDPRIDPAHWDLVVVPEHDALRGANVVDLIGSLHPVDDAWLTAGRTAFPGFADLPRPRTALLLGGSSRHVRFDQPAFEAMASMLRTAQAQEGGSVLATSSRRTPQDLRASLRRHYAGTGGAAPGVVWTDPDDGHNPYPGLLAWADRIVCSPDSVNMISEACATRAPVFVFDPARVGGRPRRFLDALLARGRVRPMDAELAPFDVEPLRETARVAAEIRARLGIPASPTLSP